MPVSQVDPHESSWGRFVARELRNAHRAVVDPRKLRDYLLSFEHRHGKYKAAFFAGLGYSRRRWARLQADLLEIAHTAEALTGERTGTVVPGGAD